MKEGDIVKEKISGYKVVLIKKVNKIFRWLDGYDWLGKINIVYLDNKHIYEKRYFRESELKEL